MQRDKIVSLIGCSVSIAGRIMGLKLHLNITSNLNIHNHPDKQVIFNIVLYFRILDISNCEVEIMFQRYEKFDQIKLFMNQK